MLIKLRNTIQSKLKRQSFSSDDEAFRFLMSILIGVFAVVVHLILLIVFLAFRNQIETVKLSYHNFFIYYNIASIVVYIFTFFLICNRRFSFFGVLVSLQGILCSVFLCLLTGIQTYGLVYLILMIMLQIQFDYGNKKMRFAIFIFALLAAMFCILSAFYIEPVFSFPTWLQTLIITVNVSIFIAGVISVLFVVNFIDKVVTNLSQIKIEELSNQSCSDELTGLYNRRYAKKFFRECLLSGASYYVAMLDIDDFKLINDTYGHNCGDEVLIFLSDFLAKHLRSTDIIIRWGGEEFLIILIDVNLEEAFAVLEKIRLQVSSETIKTKEKDLNITVTMGISPLTDDVEGTIKSCDQKMYKGKRSGKNIVIV